MSIVHDTKIAEPTEAQKRSAVRDYIIAANPSISESKSCSCTKCTRPIRLADICLALMKANQFTFSHIEELFLVYVFREDNLAYQPSPVIDILYSVLIQK